MTNTRPIPTNLPSLPGAEADISVCTEGDLMALIAMWQLDTDRILAVAEDLAAGSVSKVCRQLYGDAGEMMKRCVTKVYCLEPVDGELFDAAVSCAVDVT